MDIHFHDRIPGGLAMNQSRFIPLVMRYLVGFLAALALSVLSYLVVTSQVLPTSHMVMAVLLLLAVIQLVVQLVCFLHLSLEGRARARTMTFGFTILMMLVVVIGSLWIMKNLDYRMGMTGEAMNEYMKAQNKKGF